MHKIIIAGGRDFSDYELLRSKCDLYLKNLISSNNDIEIVSGTANGADKLGEKYAMEKGFSIKRFPADWLNLGKRAGYLRNKQMAEYADFLIACWDGNSRGTGHMIDLAKANGLPVRIIKY